MVKPTDVFFNYIIIYQNNRSTLSVACMNALSCNLMAAAKTKSSEHTRASAKQWHLGQDVFCDVASQMQFQIGNGSAVYGWCVCVCVHSKIGDKTRDENSNKHLLSQFHVVHWTWSLLFSTSTSIYTAFDDSWRSKWKRVFFFFIFSANQMKCIDIGAYLPGHISSGRQKYELTQHTNGMH